MGVGQRDWCSGRSRGGRGWFGERIREGEEESSRKEAI